MHDSMWVIQCFSITTES